MVSNWLEQDLGGLEEQHVPRTRDHLEIRSGNLRRQVARHTDGHIHVGASVNEVYGYAITVAW